MRKILVCLSGDINPVDSLVGTRTLKRCEATRDAFKTGKYDTIIWSGGKCHPPNVETQPAALSMCQWGEQQGLPVERMHVDTQARDTYENISGAIEYAQGQGGEYELTIVTHWLHAFRCWLTALVAHRLRIRVIPVFYAIPVSKLILECACIAYHLYDWKGIKGWAQKNRRARMY